MRGALLAMVLTVAPAAHAVEFGISVGALEVILLPLAHGGFYPYIGGSIGVPLVDKLTFIASLSIEYSFDQGRGGFVAVTTLDYALGERVGLDLNVAFIHDQPGLQFSQAQFFLGAGPGVSIFLGKFTLSPFLNFFGGLTVPGASIVPGLNLSRTF
jgi:hypothetical protein